MLKKMIMMIDENNEETTLMINGNKTLMTNQEYDLSH